MSDREPLEHYYAVIMAGGGGTRLWPLSRKIRPKQMLRLIDERSLFETTIHRLEGIFPPERILVVTVADQAEALRAQSPQIPPENFLLESVPRGTASVVGLAAVALAQRDSQAVMAILTADHYIGDVDRYRHLLRAAYQVALDGYLVTLGIAPTYPATGFGYIQRGESLGFYAGLNVYRVVRFIEKPDEVQAQGYFTAGYYSWNSGMFVWQVVQIQAEIARQMPVLSETLEEIARAWGTPDQADVLGNLWPTIKPQTIDYGVMEGADKVAVIPAEGLGWSDIGSWDSLFEVLPTDQQGNIIIGGRHMGVDTSRSLVYVDQEHRLIVTIGVEDLVVVDTGDVLLVCHKDQAQKVRQVVNQLNEISQDYL